MTRLNFRSHLREVVLPVYQQSLRQIHQLSYIFLELTNRCNLSCLHCGSDCVYNPEVEDLDFDAVLSTMKEIASKYDPHKITVVLSGGEPLTYPRVFELGNELTKLQFPWGMVTNGYAWTDRAFELAKKARMTTVSVSLDGMEKQHDWLRNVEGSFKHSVATIRRLVEDPFYQAMDVITCVHQNNLEDLDELRDLLIELGVKHWRFFTIAPIGRARKIESMFLPPKMYHQLMNKILAYKELGQIDVNLSESGYLGPILERQVRNHDWFCMAGISVSGIMVNGDILACPNIDRRFAQGNIHRDSFVDVWENRYKEYRNRDWMKTGVCKDCNRWAWCQGGPLHLRDFDTNETRLCHMNDFELNSFIK